MLARRRLRMREPRSLFVYSAADGLSALIIGSLQWRLTLQFEPIRQNVKPNRFFSTSVWFSRFRFDVLVGISNAKVLRKNSRGVEGGGGGLAGIRESARVSEIFPGRLLDKLPSIMPNGDYHQHVRRCCWLKRPKLTLANCGEKWSMHATVAIRLPAKRNVTPDRAKDSIFSCWRKRFIL